MSGRRILNGLEVALLATEIDPDNRYQVAMSKRAKEILARAHERGDPEDVLSSSARELANSLRERQKGTTDIETLQAFVRAKLNISNPDYR